MEKLAAIAFSLGILGQAWLVRRYIGTWIFPACLFGWFWFLYTFIPLVALYSVPVNPLAIFFILCVSCTISLTSLVFPWKQAFKRNARSEYQIDLNTWRMRQAFYICAITAVICILINAIKNGFEFSFSTYALLQSTSNFISKRYNGDIIVTVFSQLGFVSTYISAILGGFVLNRKSRFPILNITFVLAFLPSILLLIIEGNKGALPLVAAMFWASTLIRKLKMGEMRLFSTGSLKQGVLIFIIAFALIVFSFLARGLYNERDFQTVVRALVRLFASYSSGHIYAFSDWFSFITDGHASQDFVQGPRTGGFYTFMSMFQVLGDTRYVPPGVYDEYFRYGYFLQTNIYTVFRGMITDFGFWGTFVVNVVFGFMIHLSFFGLLTKRISPLNVAVFPHVVAMIYSSYIISLFIWNSTFASLLGVIVILVIVASAKSTKSKIEPLVQ